MLVLRFTAFDPSETLDVHCTNGFQPPVKLVKTMGIVVVARLSCQPRSSIVRRLWPCWLVERSGSVLCFKE